LGLGAGADLAAVLALDVPALDERELPDALGGVAGEAELGRVVQDQDRPGGGGEAGGGGREVPGQDGGLVNPRVAEEAVGGLGGGPVLARRRDSSADASAQVAEQRSEAGLQPLVREVAPVQLPLNPDVHVGAP